MLIPTDRDVKALIRLSAEWRRQYLLELSRLIEENAERSRWADRCQPRSQTRADPQASSVAWSNLRA